MEERGQGRGERTATTDKKDSRLVDEEERGQGSKGASRKGEEKEEKPRTETPEKSR